jgi:hypothetical protein
LQFRLVSFGAHRIPDLIDLVDAARFQASIREMRIISQFGSSASGVVSHPTTAFCGNSLMQVRVVEATVRTTALESGIKDDVLRQRLPIVKRAPCAALLTKPGGPTRLRPSRVETEFRDPWKEQCWPLLEGVAIHTVFAAAKLWNRELGSY